MTRRDEYIEKLKTQLDQWNAEVTKWEAKAKESRSELRIEMDRQLETYRSQRDRAVEQLRQVQAASGDAWVELVRGADDAWARMRESFERASSHFKK